MSFLQSPADICRLDEALAIAAHPSGRMPRTALLAVIIISINISADAGQAGQPAAVRGNVIHGREGEPVVIST